MLMSLRSKRLPLSANTAAMHSYPPFSLSLSFLAFFSISYISAAESSHFQKVFYGCIPDLSRIARNVEKARDPGDVVF